LIECPVVPSAGIEEDPTPLTSSVSSFACAAPSKIDAGRMRSRSHNMAFDGCKVRGWAVAMVVGEQEQMIRYRS
jgi:hypothetical protein